MAPRAKLPDCPECKEPAFEELQMSGIVMVYERHLLACKSLPLVPFDPPPDARTVVVKYDRAKSWRGRCRIT